jgi:hypothetical protein
VHLEASLLTSGILRRLGWTAITLGALSCTGCGIVCHVIARARDLITCSLATKIGGIAWRITHQYIPRWISLFLLLELFQRQCHSHFVAHLASGDKSGVVVEKEAVVVVVFAATTAARPATATRLNLILNEYNVIEVKSLKLMK